MNRALVVLAWAVLSSQISAAEVWIFLKDGRVGLGDPAASPIQVAFADGKWQTVAKEAITGQRTREQVEQAIDAMLNEIARGKNIEAHTARFRVFQIAATPRLLKRIDAKEPPAVRMAALFGLQSCWTPAAQEPVLAALHDTDPDIARAALGAAFKNIDPATFASRVKDIADHPNPAIARLVFEIAERHYPDVTLARLRRLLADPPSRYATLRLLGHYFASDLTPHTLAMLDGKSAEEKRTAIVALIQQNARSVDVRRRVRAFLESPDADFREIAAEYFTWLGDPDDSAALEAARKRETDAHARASIAGALEVIAARGPWPASAAAPVSTSDARDPYAPVLERLTKDPQSARADAFAFYAGCDASEPLMSATTTEWDAARFRSRAQLAQKLFHAPCGVLTQRGNVFTASAMIPDAGRCIPPIRNYFDPARKSFGARMGSDAEMFSNSVHIGDDAGWYMDHRTVVAIAPGVVRSVEHIPSWGHIVILEHRIAGAAVCSLYAHLSPMILVKPGDNVEAGRKIGSIGRSYSVDNGGYGAHVHFGIHRGAYQTVREIGEEWVLIRSGQNVRTKVIQWTPDETVVKDESGERFGVSNTRWISGYISPADFDSGRHDWKDPQEFLK